MLQHGPSPNGFCSGSGNPGRWLWLALVGSRRSLATGSGLGTQHVSPSSITAWFGITAERWHCWRKDEYDSVPNIGVSLLLLAPLRLQSSLGSVVGMIVGESASCCYSAPTQTVMEILILVILVNQSRMLRRSCCGHVVVAAAIHTVLVPPCRDLGPGTGLTESCASCTASSVGDMLCSPHLLPSSSVPSWVKSMAIQMRFPPCCVCKFSQCPFLDCI